MCLQVTTRYLVQGPQYIAKNVTTANPATSYSFYSYTDLALGDGLLPVNGSCNTNPNSTEFTAALNSCGNANSGCCLDMSSYTVRYQASPKVELYGGYGGSFSALGYSNTWTPNFMQKVMSESADCVTASLGMSCILLLHRCMVHASSC